MDDFTISIKTQIIKLFHEFNSSRRYFTLLMSFSFLIHYFFFLLTPFTRICIYRSDFLCPNSKHHNENNLSISIDESALIEWIKSIGISNQTFLLRNQRFKVFDTIGILQEYHHSFIVGICFFCFVSSTVLFIMNISKSSTSSMHSLRS